MPAIEVEKLTKSFGGRVVLNNVSFEVKSATMLAITGASGSGKTTLLNCVGLLDDYDSGEITVHGTRLTGIRRHDRVRYFRYQVGYLFQNYALIDDKTVAENLSVACTYASRELGSKRDWQLEALELVGLRDKLTARVFELSGGEQQRVAVARLLIRRPHVILADEPTGALDAGNRNEIMGHLAKLRDDGSTVLVVTHDPHVVDLCDDHIDL
ncbi:ATP-binding cassette domain-containing protein [Nocardia beijingensis]|uniref:ABC transporter ATP-binding protein n=1 Tax=Nocardia beijingensis TaxID=95162 RepID=UPI001893C1E7|nr:ATP-binding cassette domain-containing protein [Nocardia beijingensis]MBF6467205.1 ATP-binding cassette domain-containing protein [Nocardia beijingensis]